MKSLSLHFFVVQDKYRSRSGHYCSVVRPQYLVVFGLVRVFNDCSVVCSSILMWYFIVVI